MSVPIRTRRAARFTVACGLLGAALIAPATAGPTGAPTASVSFSGYPTTGVTGASAAAACDGRSTLYSGGAVWRCSFSEDFDGRAINTSKWNVQRTSTSGYKTGPAGASACYKDTPENVSVSGGYLRLTARKEPAVFTCVSTKGNYETQYTSGQVSTYYSLRQTYGRYEVRAKLPQTTAKGLQETFWLNPVNPVKYGAYPTSGEIDFAEFYSEYANLNVPYLHYLYDKATVSTATNTNIVTAHNCTINRTAFNTYAIEWLPGRIRLLVNNRACLVDNYVASGMPRPAPFDHPFFLVLTQALGVGTNAFDPARTPLPATTLVDYAHAWRLDHCATLAYRSGSLPTRYLTCRTAP